MNEDQKSIYEAVEATDEINCSVDLGDSHWMVSSAYRAMVSAGRIRDPFPSTANIEDAFY